MINPILKNSILFFVAIIVFISLTTFAQDRQNDFFLNQQQYVKSNQNNYASLTARDSILEEVYHWKWGKCWTAQGYRDSLIVIGNGLLIQFLDISDPENPVIVSEFDGGFESEVQNLLIRDEFLYVYTPSDIYIYLIEDEHNIHFLSLLQDVGRIVEIKDSLLVTGGTWLSTRLFNIKYPENPVSLSFVDVPGGACSIGFYENYLYITARDYPALFIYDISNPDQPVFINTYSTYNMCATFKIFEDYLYLVNYSPQQAFQILGLEQDPIYPNLISWMDLDSLAGIYMIKRDSILFMSHLNGTTTVINVADVYNPELITSFVDSTQENIGSADLGILNDYLLLAYINGPMFLEFESDSLKEIGKFFTAHEISAFAHKQDILYLASGFSGVWLFDISNPEAPKQVNNIDMGMRAWNLKIYKNLLIIYGTSILGGGREGHKFEIYDITIPDQPQYLSEFSSSKHVLWNFDFEIQNDYLFIATTDSGIFVVDIHDPYQPFPVSFFYTSKPGGQTIWDISLYGNYLYLANYTRGLKILNIADPYNIILEDSLNNVNPKLVLARDSLLYLVQNHRSKIFDISNPVSPLLISDLPVGGYTAQSVDENSKYWYISFNTFTTLIDIEDKYNPVIVDSIFTNYFWPGKNYLLNNKYIVLNGNGMHIIKNKNVTTSIDFPEDVTDFRIYVDYYPNPFNNKIIFEIHSGSLKDVKLNIYNILGQLVWSNEIKLENHHSNITWNAISKNGDSVGSGIYFVQAYVDKQPVYSGKIIYVK